MMNIHEYARFLLKMRDQQLSVPRLLGVKWFSLRILFVLVGIVALLNEDVLVKGFGIFVLGYAYGVTIADIRTQVLVKRHWPLLYQLLDWAKIESPANEESGSQRRGPTRSD